MAEFKKRIYDRYITVHTEGLYGSNTLQRIETHFKSWQHYYGPLLPENKLAKILDIGCGDGSFVYWLHQLGYQNACGIDVSPEQIDKGKALGIDNLVCEDLFSYLNKSKEAFDYIIARDVVEHFTRDAVFQLLDAVYSNLSLNGQFLVQVPNGEGIYYTSIYWGDYTHEMAYTESSLRQITRTTGFTDIVFRPVGPAPVTFFGCIRWVLWRLKVLQHKFGKMVETGSFQGIFTQNIIALIIK